MIRIFIDFVPTSCFCWALVPYVLVLAPPTPRAPDITSYINSFITHNLSIQTKDVNEAGESEAEARTLEVEAWTLEAEAWALKAKAEAYILETEYTFQYLTFTNANYFMIKSIL